MPKNSFTSQANPDQLQAITTTEGPLLIIAGPGSGKTFTLVERIVYLITHKDVTPESLFVATFTEKAAQELTTRISNRLHELGITFNLNEMYLGTLHSICLRWLDDHRDFTRLKRNFIMMDQFDQLYFIYQRYSDYDKIDGIEHIVGKSPKLSAWRKTEALIKWINMVSEEALNTNDLISASEPEVRALGECYALYQKQLEDENALDFSTIQYEALRLLQNNPDVLTELQAKIGYFMVDEYQDTNTVQEKILLTLAGQDTPNFCVVGDDDQGLYRFRGATIRNILEFPQNFPAGQCQQVELTTNYRSHPDIISFYNQWLADQNWKSGGKQFRFNKQIKPRSATFPTEPVVLTVSGAEGDGWHDQVLSFLHTLRDQGQLSDWNQAAFLFKSVKHESVVSLAQHLENNGISVYSPRSNQFFEREEVKLMIGALMFLFPQYSNIRQWNANIELEIWDYYDNDCYRMFATELRKSANKDLLRWARPLGQQHNNLTHNTDYSFAGLFYRLLQFPLFSRYLDEDLLKGGLIDSRAMRNLALFSQLLNKFEYLHHISVLTPKFLDKNLTNLFNQFFRFLKDGGIFEYEDEAEYAPSGCVSFLTIHQSKGLEFPVVLVGSLNASPRKQYKPLDEILQQSYLSKPPFEPIEQTKFYDFRRLYYTAFSRAQNLLALTTLIKMGKVKKDGTRSRLTPSKHFAPYFDALPKWTACDLSTLPLEQVKDVNLKWEYSFTSHLTVFENCAEQYRFFKELEFAPIRTNPILFGTLVHQTIEDIHKAVIRGQLDKLSERQVENWFEVNYTYLTKRERVYLAPIVKNIALNHVLRYYRRYQDNWIHIKETEVDVSLVKDSYILTGKIDLIEGQNNTVEIVDFKSEKKLDVNSPKDREKLDRYRRQLEVYAHIVEERTDQTVSKTHLYYTEVKSGNPRISFTKNRQAIQQTINTFDEVVELIEAKDFRIPARPDKQCKDCDMRFYCDRKNWSFKK
ncbi:ATP-dependent DNA helicase [Anaerolineales bacterium HSG6]|nr:ATP-dependent DNA helicase [Anaerolineales bacterium HSG6]